MAIALARPRSYSAIGWFRIVVRLTTMIALLLVCIPFYYLAKLLAGRNPVPPLFLGGIAWLAGVRLHYRGQKVRRGAFLLANHVSWIDVPALAWASGSSFVGHDGLASMPLLKWLCAMHGTVFVARYDRASVTDQVELVRAAISDQGALAIFPEGTTSDGRGLLPFKSSLLSALEPLPAGIAVQPVLLDYGPEADRIAWVGEEHGVDNFLKILARRRPVDLTIVFLPPLTGEALETRKTIAAAARETMLRELSR
ncbi:MAG: lysophospholipid acyltransferase family protein [Novosphingobium sp.]